MIISIVKKSRNFLHRQLNFFIRIWPQFDRIPCETVRKFRKFVEIVEKLSFWS